MLPREEYVEQTHFFRAYGERIGEHIPTQDLLASIREEILATTKLPMAIDYLLAELKHGGAFAPAMRKLTHYFTPFQTYVVDEAEDDRSRFDLRIALDILRREAEYRSVEPRPAAIFLYQFEAISRNRLRYDAGLAAIGADPIFDQAWRDWIDTVRRQLGLIDLADLIYVRSQHYCQRQERSGGPPPPADRPVLFGDPEGRIALANRGKEPLLLFSALHRQLGYPAVPRPRPVDTSHEQLPLIIRRLERLEGRLKLMEDEARGGISLERFMRPPEKGDRP